MNKEKKIEALSNEIRKALPYLMELSEGCLIEDTYNSIIYKVSISAERNILNEKYIQVFSLDIKNKFTLKGVVVCKHHKIIGHEPMLNDVLAWLDLVKHNEVPCIISFTGTFYDANIDEIGISWNLEKPYLKNQSNELINFFYSLIE